MELRHIIVRTSTFQDGSKNQAVALAFLDGKWHARTDLAEKFGIKPNNVNYVVGQLEKVGARVARGDVPPEPGVKGAAGVKWSLVFEGMPGPVIKKVLADETCIEFTVGSRHVTIESTPGGLVMTTPEGVDILV